MSRPPIRLLIQAVTVLAVLVPPAASAVAEQELVIVREGTKEYHRPGCQAISDGKNVIAMMRGQAESRGFKAHEACESADPSTDAPPPPAKAIVVFIDDQGKHYHRENCKKLGKPAKHVTVDEAAAKKLWPCTVCRPPIRPRPGK
jgi:hypothetical protein